MGKRRDARDLRARQMQESRKVNGHLKRKERARRDGVLRDMLGKGKLPYTPTVMNWLSHAIDTPSTQITQEHVDGFLKSVTATY